MAYKIVYGTARDNPLDTRDRFWKIRWYTAAFVLIFCLCIKLLWPEGTALLSDFLLPGELTAAEAAFLKMVDDLKTGESVAECVTGFCRSVVENGI